MASHDISTETSALRRQLVSAFVDELTENAESLNRDFLLLESSVEPIERASAIARALRASHSLKGASRIVQAEDIEATCHALEEVLVAFRDGRAESALSIMQPLFATVDALLHARRLVEEDSDLSKGPLPGQREALRRWLDQLPEGQAHASPPGEVHPPSPAVDETTIDAALVALHRDLGRWLHKRRLLPPGTESSEFLAPFGQLHPHLTALLRATRQSLATLAQARPPPAVASPPATPPTPASGTGAHVLVVDDSPTIRALQRVTLAREGYRVTVATNGAEGFAAFLDSPPDLIVMDVEMPQMDGYSLAQAVRSADRHCDVPIVMVTGLAAPEDRERAAELGVEHYMVKSLEQQGQLLSVIRRLLGRRSG